MAGEPIEAVRQGIKSLLADLRGDPQALESAYLTAITFSSFARQVCPLTELLNFQEPHLEAGGSTSLGEALVLLVKSIETEVRKTTPTQKGDWRPLVFLMTDGEPTDPWEPIADRLKQLHLGNIIACAAGPSAKEEKLKRITPNVIKLSDLQPDSLRAFFKWVSSAIKQSSVKAGQVLPDEPLGLPPPPPQIQIVP
jgi:uncharacterized protein YegL